MTDRKWKPIKNVFRPNETLPDGDYTVRSMGSTADASLKGGVWFKAGTRDVLFFRPEEYLEPEQAKP